MTGTIELRSIYSGPIRRALENMQRKVDEGDQSGNPIPAPGAYTRLVAVGSLMVPAPVIPAQTWGNVTNPITMTTKTNHWYRISMSVRAYSMPTSGQLRTRLSTNPGAPFGDDYQQCEASFFQGFQHEWLFPGTGVNAAFVGMLYGSDVVTTYTDGGHFYIEDLGVIQTP
jgi:hypothetical protein